MALARDLTASGKYTSVVLTMETGEPFREDLEGLEPAILGRWRMTCRAHLPAELRPPPWPAAARGARVGAALSEWSLASLRPLVLFLDEIDALQDDALLTVLRQIRGGYADRPQAFPASLGLVGLRDVRDSPTSPPRTSPSCTRSTLLTRGRRSTRPPSPQRGRSPRGSPGS